MPVTARTETALPALLRRIRDRFGTQFAMAAAIGISGSRLGRAMKGQDTLNALNCVRLAVAAGERPSTILRAAGKGELADLLEQLYGKSAAAIPAHEQRTLAQLHSLTTADRAAIEHLIDALAARLKPGGPPRGRR